MLIDHWTSRQGIITMQSAQCGASPILRVGDSITELMWMGLPTNPDTIQGKNAHVLNAGFMGIKVDELTPYREYAVSLSNPWCVSFQVGTNNATSGSPFVLSEWAASFESHISAIQSRSGVTKIIVKSIPPVLNATCGYDQARIDQMNQSIAGICASYSKAVFVNLDPYLKCVSTGYARPKYLLDSVHLSGGAAWTVAWLEYCVCNNQALSTPPAGC